MEEPRFLLVGLHLEKKGAWLLKALGPRRPSRLSGGGGARRGSVPCLPHCLAAGWGQDGGGILMAAMMSTFILRIEAATHAANRKPGSQRVAGNASLPLHCGFHI